MCSFDFDFITFKSTSTFSISNLIHNQFFDWVKESHSHCNFRHSTDTFNLMLDILAKFFEFDLCWHLIRRMHSRTSSSPNHTTFRVIFKRYVSAHLVQDAIDTFHHLEEFNLKDHTSFSHLIDALCEYKHVLEAQDFVFSKDTPVEATGNTKIHNMVFRGWFKLGWWSKCNEFWEEMDRKVLERTCIYNLHGYSVQSGKTLEGCQIVQRGYEEGFPIRCCGL
ncbi:hypothetical protein LR48_Vigan02g019300 [Vigna angularis]|uniref:Pentatricopeptide repeat-containing protein n=2 Tax=Phaseolus angularis TaxID=3914 RepID=A0A0L9TTY1_PHAAN|nr:pentatricopeptide repeat-containing protein At1g80550, mitochondrial [Vigna angularis]XP_052730879.1 pentatricopeptide repeat-containing protein At1g80550, mitochondrial [Vigna angularis]KOM34043.1 hypothetical protein LR48_Vigan02g019300 [Vigna angularis]BAT96504.1 hypothetical protein VIGAN_08345500 [Vigna angularis var. angularis]